MSWLLFMDESGHDHKQMPYEVRGGVAIQDRRVWPFVRAIANLELACFGVRLVDFKKEFKGEKLLDKDRLRWAFQDITIGDCVDRYGEWMLERETRSKRTLLAGLSYSNGEMATAKGVENEVWFLYRTLMDLESRNVCA